MRAVLFSWWALCLRAAAAQPGSTLFTSSQYVPLPDPNADAAPGPPTPLQQAFQRDVVERFKTDSKATVVGGKQVQLSCAQLSSRMQVLTLEWRGRPVQARKLRYTHFPQLGGRHVWLGDLFGDGADGEALAGTASVTWDDACDPAVLHLSVVLNTDESGASHVLKSVPCSGDASSKCTWVVAVRTEARDEMEPSGPPDTSADHIGRRRRLPVVDAPLNCTGGGNGTVLNVLWLYTPASASIWGEAKLKSMIAAGVVTANQALQQSRTFLRIQCVGIERAPCSVNDHSTALGDLVSGAVPGVRELRQQRRADLVQLVLEDPNYCGLSSLLLAPTVDFASQAFSTVHSQCFSVYSHLHEILHGLGAQHDRSMEPVPGQWSRFGHGKRYCDGAGSWRTVMSYSCPGSVRVGYISNPSVQYMGQPTGSWSEDNSRVIRQAKKVVTCFRNYI